MQWHSSPRRVTSPCTLYGVRWIRTFTSCVIDDDGDDNTSRGNNRKKHFAISPRTTRASMNTYTNTQYFWLWCFLHSLGIFVFFLLPFSTFIFQFTPNPINQISTATGKHTMKLEMWAKIGCPGDGCQGMRVSWKRKWCEKSIKFYTMWMYLVVDVGTRRWIRRVYGVRAAPIPII